ncbi:PAS domain S-box protein [Mesorhizobium sp. B2-1-8]|uniref:chemotaxis protein CheB n=1 Tax=Mesorhizobium sp. B2-1-8 TaxID=2589967 RepID=UPI0011298C6A|nr:chemotaxis protein CheB [Mesorhizobium sp. B2-1-8]UCI16985.1 PAS domain S-box protein [Mesorhizobium sp. B2-1-8]
MLDKANPHIVGIGASAGGVKALQEFFEALPDQVGAAFVVIMHLDPEARSEMAAILTARTAMPVMQVEDTTHLKADHVYVIAPNTHLRIADHMISALPFDEPRGLRAPIDTFFRSLADQHGDAFAIVLTGAGADGALGVKAVKEAGGIVLIQDPREAEYASMPRSAIATEVADFVLPIKPLVDRLVELLQAREHVVPQLLKASNEDHLRRILAHVRARTGHDFAQYKRATVLRRIARRAQVNRKETLEDYYSYLRDNVEEAQALFSDFLISVTTFFRDADSFASLSEHVIPKLFEGKETAAPIRIWVPGCATGEEAYSVGILLLEQAAKHDLRPEIQVFGSDLDVGALAIAREGRYPATIESDLSEERLRRFFLREGDHYRVRRELRDIVLFASHSLLKDPPFSRLDLISCRNLLIYLDRDLQQQVSSTFHYALNPGGFLFLGSSENADQANGLFATVDRDARIYRAKQHAGDRPPLLPMILSPHFAVEKRAAPPRETLPTTNYGDAAAVHRQMLERVAPPSILVDESHRALHLSHNAGRFMQPSAGPLTVDIVDQVREELRFDLRTALHRAFDTGESSLSIPVLLSMDGAQRRVYVQVKPVVEEGNSSRFALVMFIEGDALDQTPVEGSSEEIDSRQTADTIRRLQVELQQTQGRLRAMREDSEAATEELRATNEELQSINEEYRSTSEELETSREELQSINEELETVNNELKLKLDTVSRAHSDLQNLMAATDFGILFVDTALRIKRFTPRLSELFNVTESDEGRPITDFTHALEFDDMAEQARSVLKDLAPIEREIRSRKGGWYLVRMRPYRTIEDKIDGVVATFIDITERRRVEQALRDSEAHLRQEIRLVELSRSPIFVWDFDDGVVQWNRGSEELYGYSRDEAIGRHKEELLRPEVPGSSFKELQDSLLKNGMWSGEIVHHAKDGRELIVDSQIELVAVNQRRLVLESTRDITDRKRLEERQKLLLGELSHRVKNTLTVVQSMVRQTLRNTTSTEAFVITFEGRLSALANAHKLLLDTHWQGAELGALIKSQLQAYLVGGSKRIRIKGKPVMLTAEQATPFGLVLHELATNAAKYGSLSSSEGYVLLTWSITGGNDNRQVNVVWQEVDGPRVIKPERAGFGSLLIEKGIPGATVQHQFLPDGVVCTIELPLAEPKEQWRTPLTPGTEMV